MHHPLDIVNDHLLLRMPDGHWLLDTGSPQSFGHTNRLSVSGQTFQVAEQFMGLNSTRLSDLSGLQVQGLIGTDVLNAFDVVFDIPHQRVLLSPTPIDITGIQLRVNMVMGVPTTSIKIGHRPVNVFLDTGSTICYWQDAQLTDFPKHDLRSDFFPGIGDFDVQTHWVPFDLASERLEMVCGTLPGMLGLTLSAVGMGGILGNAFMAKRLVAYLPKSKKVILA